MVDISREAMAKEVADMQEFKEAEEVENRTVQEMVDELSTEELGAVIGYWDGGSGDYEQWLKPYHQRDPDFIWVQQMENKRLKR